MQNTLYESERDIKNNVIHILLYNTECEMHFHNSTEILYVVKGNVHYSCATHNDILKAGEAIFIPSFFSHKFYSEEQTETETLMLPYKFLHEFRKYHKNVSFPKLDNIEVNKKIKELFNDILISTTETKNEYLTMSLVNHLLAHIAAHYEPIPYNKENTAMVDIAMYIHDNLTTIESLESVANHFGYNPSYFSRLFKKLFENSFNTYINRLRCDYIESNKNSMPLTDLIYSAGYTSTSTYYRNKKHK